MIFCNNSRVDDLLSAEVWNITDEYNDTDPSAADGRTMPADTGFTMDAASITGISLAVVVLLGLIGKYIFKHCCYPLLYILSLIHISTIVTLLKK